MRRYFFVYINFFSCFCFFFLGGNRVEWRGLGARKEERVEREYDRTQRCWHREWRKGEREIETTVGTVQCRRH